METRLINTRDPQATAAALETLQRGELVAFPTDTVYGVAADVFSEAAIERLYQAKGRESTKAIPVLLGEVSQLDLITSGLSPIAHRLAERFWPGPLTLVVPKRPELPEALSSLPTVGVRIPDHPFAQALLQSSGPLAVTSANLSGGPNPLTAQDVLTQLGGRVALVLDGGETPGGVPSTVVDCSGEQPKVLRLGPIRAEDLEQALRA